jgi:hypothetical protein
MPQKIYENFGVESEAKVEKGAHLESLVYAAASVPRLSISCNPLGNHEVPDDGGGSGANNGQNSRELENFVGLESLKHLGDSLPEENAMKREEDVPVSLVHDQPTVVRSPMDLMMRLNRSMIIKSPRILANKNTTSNPY